jgi:hypothetical protein
MREENLTREVIAASVALAFRDYLALMELALENPGECLAGAAKIKESLLFLLYLALYLEEAQAALLRGEGDNNLLPEDDPLVILPLLRPLLYSLALFALAQKADDIKVNLLLDADDVGELLTDEALFFLGKWGEEAAREALAQIGRGDDD